MKLFTQKPKEKAPVVQTHYNDTPLPKLFTDPKIDTDSPTWAAVAAAIKKERQELLESNGRSFRTEKERDITSGKISLCDWVLNLPTKKDIEW